MENQKYKVSFFQNNTYEVLVYKAGFDEYDFWWESVFQGSISDCEAYIRLKQNESVEF